MMLISNNVVDSSVLVASSENPYYPVANVKTRELCEYYKSTAINTSISVTVRDEKCEGLAGVYILGHNLSSSASIEVRVDDDRSGSLVNILPETVIKYSPRCCWLRTPEVNGNRWQIAIVDPDNADGEIRIGRIVIGPELELPRVEKVSLPRVSTSQQSVNPSGQVRGVKGYSFYEFNVNFPALFYSQKQCLDEVFDEVHNFIPFVVLPFEQDDIEPPLYVVFNQDRLEWDNAIGNIHEAGISLKFREAF